MVTTQETFPLRVSAGASWASGSLDRGVRHPHDQVAGISVRIPTWLMYGIYLPIPGC